MLHGGASLIRHGSIVNLTWLLCAIRPRKFLVDPGSQTADHFFISRFSFKKENLTSGRVCTNKTPLFAIKVR